MIPTNNFAGSTLTVNGGTLNMSGGSIGTTNAK